MACLDFFFRDSRIDHLEHVRTSILAKHVNFVEYWRELNSFVLPPLDVDNPIVRLCLGFLRICFLPPEEKTTQRFIDYGYLLETSLEVEYRVVEALSVAADDRLRALEENSEERHICSVYSGLLSTVESYGQRERHRQSRLGQVNFNEVNRGSIPPEADGYLLRVWDPLLSSHTFSQSDSDKDEPSSFLPRPVIAGHRSIPLDSCNTDGDADLPSFEPNLPESGTQSEEKIDSGPIVYADSEVSALAAQRYASLAALLEHVRSTPAPALRILGLRFVVDNSGQASAQASMPLRKGHVLVRMPRSYMLALSNLKTDPLFVQLETLHRSGL
jgi:hypothetical protein